MKEKFNVGDIVKVVILNHNARVALSGNTWGLRQIAALRDGSRHRVVSVDRNMCLIATVPYASWFHKEFLMKV